jgi:hypothetical protein
MLLDFFSALLDGSDNRAEIWRSTLAWGGRTFGAEWCALA